MLPQIVKIDPSFTHGIILEPDNSPSPEMFFVYFNAQVTSFHEHATSYEYVRLPGHKILNSPFALGQLQTLFTPGPVVKFSADTFKGTIGIVRVLDDEWSRKSIIELSDEF